MAAVIPVGNEGPDPFVQLGHRGDIGPVQGLTSDDAEPDFHEVGTAARSGDT